MAGSLTEGEFETRKQLVRTGPLTLLGQRIMGANSNFRSSLKRKEFLALDTPIAVRFANDPNDVRDSENLSHKEGNDLFRFA